MNPPTLARLVAALALALPLAAAAQSYRCTGKDGKKYYGATIPAQCVGVPVEQLSAQGTVLRRLEPPPPAEAREAERAEAQRRREDDAAARDAVRRNRALLATYRSEKDIEDARARALEDSTRALERIEARIAALKADTARLQKSTAPTRAEELRNAQLDLRAQEDLLAAKRKEAGIVNGRYDEDLRRYRELAAMDPAARGRALGVEKGVTVTTRPPSRHEQQREEREARRRAAQERSALQRLEMEREQERRRQELERLRQEHDQRYNIRQR